MREPREPARIDELESKLRAAAPSRADDETLARVHAEVLRSAAREGAQRARRPSARRWWVAAVAAAAVLVVAVAGLYATGLVSQRSRGGAGVAQRPPGAGVKDALAGLPQLPVDRALALSNVEIRLPSSSAAGVAAKAALITPPTGSMAATAATSTRADTGVAVLFASGTLLSAVPLSSGVVHEGFVAPDPAVKALPERKVAIGRRRVTVIPDAVRLEAGGHKLVLGLGLRWTDGGIQYTLVSDTLSLSQLEDVVLSIK